MPAVLSFKIFSLSLSLSLSTSIVSLHTLSRDLIENRQRDQRKYLTKLMGTKEHYEISHTSSSSSKKTIFVLANDSNVKNKPKH